MDLGVWDAKYYTPTMAAQIKMALGGKRFRCEACRCNFVTFRLMKERSTFRKRVVNRPLTSYQPPSVDRENANPDSGNDKSDDRIQVA